MGTLRAMAEASFDETMIFGSRPVLILGLYAYTLPEGSVYVGQKNK